MGDDPSSSPASYIRLVIPVRERLPAPDLLLACFLTASSCMATAVLVVWFQVQHLIERCLLLYMGKDECVEALSKQANINPVITATVWTELEKENREFFEAYSKNKEVSVMEMRAVQAAPNPLAAHSAAPRDRPDNRGDY